MKMSKLAQSKIVAGHKDRDKYKNANASDWHQCEIRDRGKVSRDTRPGPAPPTPLATKLPTYTKMWRFVKIFVLVPVAGSGGCLITSCHCLT